MRVRVGDRVQACETPGLSLSIADAMLGRRASWRCGGNAVTAAWRSLAKGVPGTWGRASFPLSEVRRGGPWSEGFRFPSNDGVCVAAFRARFGWLPDPRARFRWSLNRGNHFCRAVGALAVRLCWRHRSGISVQTRHRFRSRPSCSEYVSLMSGAEGAGAAPAWLRLLCCAGCACLLSCAGLSCPALASE